MIFTQLAFLLFFAVTFGGHWLLKGNEARKIWLLLTSCFFYGYWDERFLLLIFFSIVVDYFTARGLAQENRPRVRKLLITASICVNLGILGFFKYYNFFADSTFALLHELGFHADAPTLRIVLPVGVSFFTFQSMTYTVDVYRRQLSARKSFLDFSLYVLFFPQLVAGPIVRAIDFLPQLDTTRVWKAVDGRRALMLFAIGYFKKTCLADNIAHAIDPLFASPLTFDGPSRVLGAVLYSVQIY
ncbi:MAG TPA: MBOAT family protein, partial [Polyangiaceae bacterium]|nr:MBOAT family protein [Polyangiaceae bacterium]